MTGFLLGSPACNSIKLCRLQTWASPPCKAFEVPLTSKVPFTVLPAQYFSNLTIWQAPRASSMRRILCSDWLPEQDGAILPARNCQFCSRKQKFKRVHESFLSPKLFSAKVKRFFVFSLSLWNQKKRQRE